MFNSLSALVGVSEDQIRLIVLILSSFFFGYLNYFLTNPQIRLLFGLVTGILLEFLMYGYDCIHIFIATIVTYVFIRFFGRKYSPFWILFITVAHLSVLHIDRMIKDFGGWNLDATTIYMMSICKFSSLAFSYDDGGKPDSKIRSQYHRSKKVVEMPTLLEVFAYIFYFPSAVVGPSFEFSDFISFVRLEGAYKNIPKNLAFYNAAVELLISFSMMAVYVLMVGVFDPLYCSSKEFAAESLFYKYFYMNVAMSVQRAKYYTCWKMAQAGVIFCGLSYNPTKRDKQTPSVLLADGDGGEYEHKFDKIENVVISEVELNPNSKKKIQYWNRTVHLWLKYNLYLRILATGKSNSVASLAAFMVSAFWHGFYPVYYIFFFLFYIFEQVNDMLDKLHFFHYLESLNPVLHYTAVMLFTSMCNYLGITFVNLTVIRWYEFTRQLYFIPLIAIFGMYAICSALLSRKRREKQKD